MCRIQDPRRSCRWTVCRQEVPIHIRCLHQRKNLQVSTLALPRYASFLIFYYIFNNYNVNRGVVISTKMKRTIIIRRDYLHYVKKYNRFEKRHKNLAAHCSPAFPRIKEGDVVVVGQCRPLSKTVRFNVIKLESKRIEGNVKKQFVLF
jgi:ribosomal protein S17